MGANILNLWVMGRINSLFASAAAVLAMASGGLAPAQANQRTNPDNLAMASGGGRSKGQPPAGKADGRQQERTVEACEED